ncbi:response regulator [Chroococcidiopsis sp. TS-821]|uniref:response regulator n=1 Tax=Chroococcidiopsis sp. TS-821 TaxID=1378066 RepID=UPI000CEDF0E8|nr:response regulator [Chroococcidiopsis sp. TS-821]PPS40263.1 PAS sensor protein [Chroococcidiopsis sp. TS-821]
MSSEQFRQYIRTIQKQIAKLQEELARDWSEIAEALDGLQLIHEEMQTSLEAAEVVEQTLLQQNQQIAAAYQYYYDLFQTSPIAYVVTDANGLILEANQAIAQLLKVPQRYLLGKPLAVYVAEGERHDFYTKLSRAKNSGIQVWQMSICPREDTPLAVEFYVSTVRSDAGLIELRIAVSTMSLSRETTQAQHLNQEAIRPETRFRPHLPQSLDGLRVLVVDDEPDVREFITAILEPYGIGVRAVTSAAAALAELEQFHPDVLVSDIRMPGEDGYSLIQQIRAWEALRGRHIPAAAITAYLDEDREKALSAGFEAHLHKLAPPTDLIKMVAQLAGRAAKQESDALN